MGHGCNPRVLFFLDGSEENLRSISRRGLRRAVLAGTMGQVSRSGKKVIRSMVMKADAELKASSISVLVFGLKVAPGDAFFLLIPGSLFNRFYSGGERCQK